MEGKNEETRVPEDIEIYFGNNLAEARGFFVQKGWLFFEKIALARVEAARRGLEEPYDMEGNLKPFEEMLLLQGEIAALRSFLGLKTTVLEIIESNQNKTIS